MGQLFEWRRHFDDELSMKCDIKALALFYNTVYTIHKETAFLLRILKLW